MKVLHFFAGISFLALISGCTQQTDQAEATSILKSFSKLDVSHARPTAESRDKAIYNGDDSRLDAYEITDPEVRALLPSIMALVNEGDVTEQEEGTFRLSNQPLFSSMDLCPEDSPEIRFQPSAAFCSGFVVAPNMIATAGHCVRSADSCESTYLVRNYQMLNAEDAQLELGEEDVYRCEAIVSREERGFFDYAILRLDRDIVDATPLQFRTQRDVEAGSEIFVMGFPNGTPVKYAGDAEVVEVFDRYFDTTLDTFRGNSGSAVFLAETHEVLGILVAGAADYRPRGNCNVLNYCVKNQCDFEQVSDIWPVRSVVPGQGTAPVVPVPEGPTIPRNPYRVK